MTKKRLTKVGMVVSILVAICGVLVILGAMGGDTSGPGGAPSYYDHGYASFGADFYSYVSNNAAEAAEAARTTASNLGDIADLLRNVCGIFLIGFGMMGFCVFGIINAGFKEAAAVAAPVTPVAPVAEPVVEETAEAEEAVAEPVVEAEEVEPETEASEVETAEETEEDKEKILAKLHELKDEGILTEEEFEEEKNKILNK